VCNRGMSGILACAAILVCAPAAQAAQEFPVLPADAPAGDGAVQACEIEDVAGAVRCGTYRVFEDRDAGAGRTVDLAFVVLGALEPERAPGEAVVLLPGGPGESFTDNAALFAEFFAHLRRSRDILLADVRGVGRSQPLDCPEFRIPIERRFRNVFPPEHIVACRDALSENARLDLYTTNTAVDDVDELRRWLGYDAVHLHGGSYGTRVAQVYLRRHPEAVRTATLNSVTPVFEPGYVHMARSLQTALDAVLEACAADAECDGANPDLRDQFDRVLARLERASVEVDVRGVPVQFTSGDFSYALRGLLYGRSGDVPRLIRRASEGDFAELADYYVERTAWIGEGGGGAAGYHFSALCAEDIAPLTDEQVARHSEGTFMGDHLIEGYREVCRLWDVAELPASFWDPVRTDTPVLLISGEWDPVTPAAWGDAVAEHLPNSVHVVVPGGGHYPRNDCTLGLEEELLETGEVSGLDLSCVGAVREGPAHR
jgi:pimeloyl-ACP methyl ester carboxylesterase